MISSVAAFPGCRYSQLERYGCGDYIALGQRAVGLLRHAGAGFPGIVFGRRVLKRTPDPEWITEMTKVMSVFFA